MKLFKLKIKTINQNYNVIIGNEVIRNFSKILDYYSINFNKCLLVIDKKVPKYLIGRLSHSLKNKKKISYFFNSNEVNKNQKSVNKLLRILLKNNFHRNDCLIAVGGGITGDVSGYVASIFKRGIKFINIPTTLLSQVDSSIGGKTGINTTYGKNLIGTFYQPNLVISDTSFLKSLPYREIVCGYAEILKHSLIKDKKFFTYLNKNVNYILKIKSTYIEKAIYKSCLIKKLIVEKDENEKNLRKILNFGHTFAHAYEATLNYSKKLNHGEAVLLGIMSATKFSFNNNLLSKKDFTLIKSHLLKPKLFINLKKFFFIKDLNRIITFMKKDKKNNTNKINLVLLKKIGKPIYNLNFNDNKIKFFLKKKLIN